MATRSKGRNPAKPLSQNKHLLRWVEKMAVLCAPDSVHWDRLTEHGPGFHHLTLYVDDLRVAMADMRPSCIFST